MSSSPSRSAVVRQFSSASVIICEKASSRCGALRAAESMAASPNVISLSGDDGTDGHGGGGDGGGGDGDRGGGGKGGGDGGGRHLAYRILWTRV